MLLFSNKGKQELLSDQIKKEEEKFSAEGVKNRLEEIEQSILAIEAEKEDYSLQGGETTEEIDVVENTLKALKPTDFTKKRKQLTDKKLELSKLSK